jgi:multidrug efflux system membrane fusion protein
VNAWNKSLAAPVAALLLMVSAGCSGAGAGAAAVAKSGAPKEPAPVRIAEAVMQSLPVEIENIATVEPIATVEVRAQVSGEVMAVLFKEGDAVAEGQELFRIDPRPFEATLKQLEAKLARARAMQDSAQADVARNKAEAENTRTELERNKTLLDREMVTQAEYDTARMQASATAANVNASQAAARSMTEDIRAAEADIERARLDLEYCVIRAPLTGRAGALLVHKGDIVRANDSAAMVTLTQLKPIYVSFTLPEKHLAEVRMRMQQGPLTVRAAIPSVEHAPAEGTLTFVDNMVDTMTSTIRLKATFANEDEYLWPGQYVRAAVEMSVQSDVIVTPAQAVQTGQKGTYVYVIGGDMLAALRTVKPGARKDGLVVIEEGLKAGEKVVIDGHMRVAPGQAVSIVTDEAPAKEDGGAGKGAAS